MAPRKLAVGGFVMGSCSIAIWPSRFLVPVGCGLALSLALVKLGRAVALLLRPDPNRPEPEPAGDPAASPRA